VMRGHHPQSLSAAENLRLWQADEQSFDAVFLAPLNEQRAALDLAPVEHVAGHITTDHAWLAADPVLAPSGTPVEMSIWQTGAWLAPNPAPLPEDLERFLAAGEPPLYFGFGSMRAGPETSQLLIAAARAVGRRAILLRGWGNLAVEAADDCIAIGEVAHEALLPRVAAIVHHGGAGTTTAAARAGRPQVVVPHNYDQPYWAHRVATLGVGVVGPTAAELTVDGLVAALHTCLAPDLTERAAALSGRIERRGARIAAERLSDLLAGR
jgi:vancomycin aglycone glucosyltransferase